MPPTSQRRRRKVCFVTGTRAEFGLMQSTLRAIQLHPDLSLQLIVTGMHLDRSRGRSLETIRRAGWEIDQIVRWRRGTSQSQTAVETGRATARLAGAFERLESDIVLIAGDRVEAFAAASAAHISGRVVAHVHGGDRARGIVDDSLRHAITKLAHIHFPATTESAGRILRMGEDRWRIHRVGSPGLDDLSDALPWSNVIERFPNLRRRRYALIVLHPSTPDPDAERLSAQTLLDAVKCSGVEQALVIYPNNDPGSAGVVACWNQTERACLPLWHFVRDVPRMLYLGLLRNAAMLVGNSSSGIIEAASFGASVIDIGRRQEGRERGANVKNVANQHGPLLRAIREAWHSGNPAKFTAPNVYGSGNSGKRIAKTLARIELPHYVRKLISY